MPMVVQDVAQRLTNAYKAQPQEAQTDFQGWYGNELNKVNASKKNKPGQSDKNNNGNYQDSSISGIELPRTNEGKECPVCKHKHCNCNYHNPNNPNNENDNNPNNNSNNPNVDDNGIDLGGFGGMNSPSALAYAKKFAKELDDEFQKATPLPTQNISLLIAKGTLNFSWKQDPISNALEIATKVAAYFTMCILPIGIPAAGVITSVTNTAPTIISPLAQELLSISQNAANDNFVKFCETVIKHVKTIKWTVTEQVGPAPAVYVVSII